MRHLIFSLLLMTPLAGSGQDDVSIERLHVSGHVHLLYGKGGNIGVSAGPDGLFLIDDQYAPLTDKILEALRPIADQPPRFVINTHWHGDHTGGNENFGRRGAVIVAHDNVRERMSSEQFNAVFNRRTPTSPEAALPVVTFTQRMSFHVNGDRLDVIHVPHAHTDGDAIIHFRKADVLHMGDTFFNGLYPFIDRDSGGHIDGMIAAVEAGLARAGDATRVIPGHGPLTDTAGLKTYHRMLTAVRAQVRALIDDGADLAAVQAAHPTKPFDEAWGGGFISPERFVSFIYDSLTTADGPP